MKKKTLLDSIDVPKPCDKSWDEMLGDDVSRLCRHCEKDIYNISAMTRQEAKKLLFQAKEKVCIRMEREPDGRIKTLKKQLHQITRQMPLAAGVLTASLILSGTTNAQETKVESSKITITQTADKNSKPTISGIITDSNGAVIPGVKVILRNTKDNSVKTTISDEKGFYEFKDVEASTYEIKAEQLAFKSFIINNLVVESDKNINLAITLQFPLNTNHEFVFEEPVVTTEQLPLRDKITPRQIESLPIPPRNLLVLGLFPGMKEEKLKKQIKTSQMSFTILDPNGMVIPNAKVVMTKQITKEEFTIFSDASGVAKFGQILRGKYEFKVMAHGFMSNQGFIKVKKSIEPNVKISLTVGTLGEVIFIKKP